MPSMCLHPQRVHSLMEETHTSYGSAYVGRGRGLGSAGTGERGLVAGGRGQCASWSGGTRGCINPPNVHVYPPLPSGGRADFPGVRVCPHAPTPATAKQDDVSTFKAPCRLGRAGQSCAFQELGCWMGKGKGPGQAAWYCGLTVGRVLWASGLGSCSEFLFLPLGMLVWPLLNGSLSAGMWRR